MAQISKKALLAELQKRQKHQKEEAEKPVFKLEEFCFPKQLEFLKSGNSRFKTVVASRRAGKTKSIVADMISTCINEKNVTCLYITLTQQNARNIIWHDLIKVIEDYEIDCKIDNTRLSITFNKTRSRIRIAGAKDRQEIEKYRGLKLRKCYIDECQSFRSYIKELINDVIAPALRDLRGELYLTGTPGPVPAGVFYDFSHSDFWENHHWTAFDNPYMHNPPKLDLNQTLLEERTMKGIDESDPGYIRETYGKWVEDQDSLVFKFNPEKNTFSLLPEGNYDYIVGIDVGYEDSDAIAVLAYDNTTDNVYLVDEYIKNKQDITALMEEIKKVKNKYNPIKMVMDAGALGKKIHEELKKRHQLPIEAADKHRKIEYIELLNSDLRRGYFKAFQGSIFEEDCRLVQWDKESIVKNPERPKVSNAYHSDACFIAGSEVITSTGVKPIELVEKGDLVLTHKGNFKKVLNTMNRTYEGPLKVIEVAGIKNKIKCTPEHRFYTSTSKRNYSGTLTGQVTLSEPTWTAAKDLISAPKSQKASYVNAPKAIHEIDSVKSKQFTSLNKRVKSIEEEPFKGTVYNIEVEDDNSYTIEGISVHNCDAVLYAWRECKHYISNKPVVKHTPGTSAYMEEMEAKEAARMENRKNNPYWEQEEAFEEDINELDSLLDDPFSDW